MTLGEYCKNVLIALDCLLNTILRGRPGETLSERAATARRDGRRWGCVLCAVLDWIDKDHCRESVGGDVDRAEQVIRDSTL